MHYTFPEICTIDDVLPHIDGRSEFIVAEREFGTVINYVVAMADTFDMTGPDDLTGRIRRECRGIIFEYISPTNKIVIDYSEPKLVLLGARNNITGNYFMPNTNLFEIVPQYGSVDGSLSEYIARAREQQGREGDIIRFLSGHMIKIKNDWYVRIHKTKDLIRTDRNIADIIINEQLDDVLPLLDATDMQIVRAYEKRFDAALENVLGRLEGLVTLAKVLHGGVKKDVALNFIPNLKHKEDAQFIFSALDGKELRPLVIKKVKESINNGPKYEAMMAWMEA